MMHKIPAKTKHSGCCRVHDAQNPWKNLQFGMHSKDPHVMAAPAAPICWTAIRLYTHASTPEEGLRPDRQSRPDRLVLARNQEEGGRERRRRRRRRRSRRRRRRRLIRKKKKKKKKKKIIRRRRMIKRRRRSLKKKKKINIQSKNKKKKKH